MDRLSHTEQIVVRRASVFARDFSPEAVEAIVHNDIHDNKPVSVVLARMVDQGIVLQKGPEPGTRFRLVNTILEHARNMLAATGEEEQTYRRLTVFYSELAEEVLEHAFGPERARWIDRLGQESANLAAVLRWLIDHDEAELGLRLAFLLQELWFEPQHAAEGRAWLTALLSLPSAQAPTSLRAQALDLAGALAIDAGEYAAAQDLKDESLAIFREIGDIGRLGFALLHTGHLAGYAQGDFETAGEFYQQALETFRECGHEEGTSHALANLARVAMETGTTAGRAYS